MRSWTSRRQGTSATTCATSTATPPIDIQGGEPTIWRHIEELVAYCHEIGLYPTLITNAIALAKRPKCEQLKQAGIRDLLISVQGLGAVYDEIVGLPGGAVKQAQALQQLHRRRHPLSLQLRAQPEGRCHSTSPSPSWPCRPEPWRSISSAFNPFEDQATGHRSTVNVPRYSDVAVELNKALDVLADADVEANVRYFPACMVEERHRKSMYNFQQLSYDPHEWDYDSWSWTGQQPQRMKWGDPSEHHSNLAGDHLQFVGLRRAGSSPAPTVLERMRTSAKQALEPFPAMREAMKRAYWSRTGVHRRAAAARSGGRPG